MPRLSILQVAVSAESNSKPSKLTGIVCSNKKIKNLLILDLICTLCYRWVVCKWLCLLNISTIGPSSSLGNQTGLLQSKTNKDEGLQKKISSINKGYIKLAREIFTEGWGGRLSPETAICFWAYKFSAKGGGKVHPNPQRFLTKIQAVWVRKYHFPIEALLWSIWSPFLVHIYPFIGPS